jgi:hypothetical protein
MFNLEQAFYLRDDDEAIGFDFKSFYFLMRSILAVKYHSKTKFGALTVDEFKDLMNNHSFFVRMNKYMDGSYIMSGDSKL